MKKLCIQRRYNNVLGFVFTGIQTRTTKNAGRLENHEHAIITYFFQNRSKVIELFALGACLPTINLINLCRILHHLEVS